MSGRRRSGGFASSLLIAILVCGGLVAAGIFLLESIEDAEPPAPQAACAVEDGERSGELDVEQTANAATISGTAFAMGLPRHAVVVAYAAVWQESQFYNLSYGDRDSVGLFQQRPSMDWGEPDQLMDPVFASTAFYEELAEVPGYIDMPVSEAAQTVQRSVDGSYYDRHEERSRAMAEVFTGSAGPAVDCWFPPEDQEDPDVAGAAEELARVYGTAPADLPLQQESGTGDLGWAMALWSVGNARDFGLSSVTYGEHQWTASDAQGNWAQLEPGEALPEGELQLA